MIIISQNTGKRFEQAIKQSVPDYILYHRLNDSTGTFSGGANLRFSSKQPCDAFAWDGKRKIFYALELKTTKSKSFSFESPDITEKQNTKMIHKHQIHGLYDLGQYEGVISGFLFNFRDENICTEETYFQSISDFISMIKNLNKKSFNKNDLLKYNPVTISGNKKRTRWTWDLEKFFSCMGR